MGVNQDFCVASDVEAVVTSFNQGFMISEAVRSLCRQTMLPARIILVDDGSTDEDSIRMLDHIESDEELSVPLTVLRQKNLGVSAARNAGIQRAGAPFVVVLDGDDRLYPSFLEEVGGLLRKDPAMVAASSWLGTFGILEKTVCPSGGDIRAFLSKNACPATHMLRREVWKVCGGYEESMRAGFEDWEFFLSMLETAPDAHIGIVEKPLIAYRTATASSNIKSMEKRLALMREIMEKHIDTYRAHVTDAVLGVEEASAARLCGWESEIRRAIGAGHALSGESEAFMEHPTYGDGGMAAAVRIAAAERGV